MLWSKKNSYKEFDNEKNSCGSKILLPPHKFSNGPSLKWTTIRRGCAKYRDQFVSVLQVNYSAEVNNWSAKHTDKSWYLAITECIDFFIILSPSLFFRINIFRKRGDLPFLHKSDPKKEKSVVLFTHDQNININYLQPNILDNIAHEQTIYCWQLFGGHVVGPRPMNSPYSLWNMRN